MTKKGTLTFVKKEALNNTMSNKPKKEGVLRFIQRPVKRINTKRVV